MSFPGIAIRPDGRLMLPLDYTKATLTQQFTQISTAIEAASETIVVSVAGAYARSATTGTSDLGLAGSFSSDVIKDQTYAHQ